MKISYTVSPDVQDILDSCSRPQKPGRTYEVWTDESTGLLCKVSDLSGTTMGFVGVPLNHPWFNRNECPLKGISVFGTIRHPEQCRGLWWFYFTDKKGLEDTKQKCRLLAAQLEIEGTELAQEIASLRSLKKEGNSDVSHQEVRANCTPIPPSSKFSKSVEKPEDGFRRNLENLKKVEETLSKDKEREYLDFIANYLHEEMN